MYSAPTRVAVAFYFKFFLNPDVRCFPATEQVTSQRAMQLKFAHEDGFFHITTGGGATLRASPPLRRGEPKPPVHRFPSLAVASKYTAPSAADTEDDLLCVVRLRSIPSSQVASQHRKHQPHRTHQPQSRGLCAGTTRAAVLSPQAHVGSA